MTRPTAPPPVIRDPAFPGLEMALRGEIVPHLSAALGKESGGAWSLGEAIPVRFRHRPGKRAIVQYALTLSGPKGELKTPAALWFFAGGKAAKLARNVTVEGLDGSAPPPVALDPVTGGLLQVFPHDHRAPQVAAYLQDPGAHTSALLGGTADAAGAPELVRFRPGIGATFRWDRGDATKAYVKIHAGMNTEDASARLESLHRSARQAGFATPCPVGWVAEIAAISVEGIEGFDFGGILATGKLPEIQAVAHRAARALAGMHRCAIAMHEEMDRGALVQKSDSAAASIANTCFKSSQSARDLAHWINQTSVPLRLGPGHMDMKPEHLIITGSTVVLLDLDCIARSDGLYDVAMLEMRIHSACATGACDADQANAAIRALYDAYPHDGDACRPQRLAWLRACAALQVAKHHVQNPSDGWHERVTRVLEAGYPVAQAVPDVARSCK